MKNAEWSNFLAILSAILFICSGIAGIINMEIIPLMLASIIVALSAIWYELKATREKE